MEPRLLAASPATPSPPVSRAGDPRFGFVVPASQGATEFLFDDSITIEEVRGTTSRFQVGARYQVIGTYRLASRKHASLVASVTATERRGSISASPSSSAQLTEGTGRFVIELPLEVRGYPHVTLYSEEGDVLGGVYFGRDEWLLQTKDWSDATPKPDHRLPDPRDGGFKPL